MTRLGPGGEFDRIRAVWKRLGDRLRDVGDDCALVTVTGETLALSTDMAVENHHFRRAWVAPDEIGWRAAAGALSDLAAVAATPWGVLASIGVPAADADGWVPALMDGIADAAAAVGADVWGGDLVQSDAVVVGVTVVGRANRPVRRGGARPGDTVWVTGALGGPVAAVRAWMGGGEPEPAARERFARPLPRIAAAQWLRDHGATGMIDLSDGLAGDAGHIAAASGVALAIETERLPVHPAAAGWEDAAAGGEEYELLVTLPPDTPDPGAFADRFGFALTRIGTVEAGDGVRFTRAGAAVAPPAGFSHF